MMKAAMCTPLQLGRGGLQTPTTLTSVMRPHQAKTLCMQSVLSQFEKNQQNMNINVGMRSAATVEKDM